MLKKCSLFVLIVFMSTFVCAKNGENSYQPVQQQPQFSREQVIDAIVHLAGQQFQDPAAGEIRRSIRDQMNQQSNEELIVIFTQLRRQGGFQVQFEGQQ